MTNDTYDLKAQYSKKELFHLCRPNIIRQVLSKALDGKFELFEKQREIILSPASFKVIRAARRTAKSFNEAFIGYAIAWFCGIWDYPFHVRFGAPSYDDTLHIWAHFKKFWKIGPLDEVFPRCKISYDNWNSKSTNQKTMDFADVESFVRSGSGDSPEMNDFRGDWHDFIALDEYGQFRYKELAIDAMMYSLKDAGPLNMAMIVGTSDVTVDLGQTFQRLFDLGQGTNPKIKSWHLKETDNPYRDAEAADVSKAIVTEDGYLREAQGEAIPPTGRLFPEFDFKAQVVPTSFKPGLDYMIGVDFGFRKPIAEFFQIKMRQDLIFEVSFFFEIADFDIATLDLVRKMEIGIKNWANNRSPLVVGADPAGDNINAQTAFTDFQILKKYFPQAQYTTNLELRNKSNQVNYLWRPLISRVKIDPKCKRLASAVALASPDRTLISPALRSGGWKKEKGLDDPLDAATYGMLNFEPTARLILQRQKRAPAPSDEAVRELERLIWG